MSASDPNQPEHVSSVHQPVMLPQVLEYLALEPGLIVVDGTVGGGGHSREILKHVGPHGTLIGLDRDPTMLARAASTLVEPNCQLRNASYAELRTVLDELEIDRVDRILVDLGLSSDQLADTSRGFGFNTGGPLDLRFNLDEGQPAWKLLARVRERELEDILRVFGEERFARSIARTICARRKLHPIETAQDLVDAVEAAIPGRFLHTARKHPSTRVFQALRIAVNEELSHLERFLTETAPACLRNDGRVVAISFHSLEDRIVKHAFRDKDRWENLTRKPLTADFAEVRANPRSRSAKLRAAKIR